MIGKAIRTGWRGFAVEIVIVVAGVLIALGAQQLAENWNDRQRSERDLAAVRAELIDIDFAASELEIVTPCVLAQLDAVQQRLVSGDRTPFPQFRQSTSGGTFVVRAPSRVWSSNVWSSVSDSGVLRRTRPTLERDLSNVFSQIDSQRRRNEDSRDRISQLSALSVLVPQSEDERFRLLGLIAQIRGGIALQDLVAGQLRDAMARAGMLADRAGFARSLRESGTIQFCRQRGLPLGPIRPAVAANAD